MHFQEILIARLLLEFRYQVYKVTRIEYRYNKKIIEKMNIMEKIQQNLILNTTWRPRLRYNFKLQYLQTIPPPSLGQFSFSCNGLTCRVFLSIVGDCIFFVIVPTVILIVVRPSVVTTRIVSVFSDIPEKKILIM